MSISTRVCSLALAGIILVPAVSAAQSGSPVSFGVKGGVNSATLKFDDSAQEAEVKSLWGGVAGVFLGKALSDNVGVRLEGLFSQKGAKNAEGGEDAKYRLTYVDVPLLLTFGPASANDTRFHVFTGPQVSFNTAAKFSVEGLPDEDFSNQIASNDFGWVLGVGVEGGRFSLDARYALGLKDISTDNSKVKNRVFSVMAGVRLK